MGTGHSKHKGPDREIGLQQIFNREMHEGRTGQSDPAWRNDENNLDGGDVIDPNDNHQPLSSVKEVSGGGGASDTSAADPTYGSVNSSNAIMYGESSINADTVDNANSNVSQQTLKR